MELLVACEQTLANTHFTVESRFLMRVFAVAHILDFDELTRKAFGEVNLLTVFAQACEIVGNHRVVAGGVAENFLSQSQSRGRAHFTFFFQFGKHLTVIGRIHNNRDTFMVFSRRADHCRTADIDIFDRVFKSAIRFGHRCFKRIEIDNDDIDGIDIVIGQSLHVFRIGTTGQDAGMNLRI